MPCRAAICARVKLTPLVEIQPLATNVGKGFDRYVTPNIVTSRSRGPLNIG